MSDTPEPPESGPDALIAELWGRIMDLEAERDAAVKRAEKAEEKWRKADFAREQSLERRQYAEAERDRIEAFLAALSPEDPA